MRIPDFFIIGAPKCGTTTLHEWLSAHPLICAPRKETCFFSQDIFPTSGLSTHIHGLDEYCKIFNLKDDQITSGEATPKYLYSDLALSEISKLNPDARIIVCLRDPVDLVVSLYNQKLREGVEKAPSFEQAWYASLACIKHGGAQLPHERHYYLWACIGSRLMKLHEFFGTDNILILLSSELRAAPADSYRKVLSHIGIPDDARTDFSSHNERVAIRSLWVHQGVIKVKKLFNPVLKPLYKLRRGRGLGIIKTINRINTQPGRYTDQASEELRQDMYVLLKPEIELAESYLGGRKLVGSAGQNR